jgi:glutamine synthetase type III
MTANDRLTPAQRRAIAALLTARDTRSAATLSGVNERTLHRWLTLTHFRAELQKAENQAINTAIRRLSELTSHAVDTLREIMSDKSVTAGTRVQAANIVLSRLLDLRELQEFELRLRRIEEKLNLE